ncbi:hypothetical protein [Streptomyces minutiscleroticus]|uniref:Alpha/beta hydrolase n=1 Tax=Streptomyces minutiscleroticus TaxID=68238 RepID=A0A918NRM9_9ACTN|nr:hypothetical protein [Streptomyces minutiscleroticus]GGX90257.1 hypothetical protein GCM10010358_50270 [Streptomyces minutiscleroticus]
MHGAAGYAAVIPLLLRAGPGVVAPAVPDRRLGGDSAYVVSLVRAIPGPAVLVGHAYGGAVVTVAGVQDDVTALVHLAGYAPDEGECLAGLQAEFPAPPPAGALVRTRVPGRGPDGTGTEVSVDAARFPALLAADVDPAVAPPRHTLTRAVACHCLGDIP